MLRGVLMLVLGSIVSFSSGALEPNCPEYTTAAAAVAWFKSARVSQPKSTARCLAERAFDLPTRGDDGDAWRGYLLMAGIFLQQMHDRAPDKSLEQKLYKKAEPLAWEKSREWTALQLASTPSGPRRAELIRDYNLVVNHLSNAYWRLAELKVQTLQPFHEKMMDLSPFYLMDQTAVRWLEATRACPAWVPDGVKRVPSYAEFCAASCQFDYKDASKRLTAWASALPEPPAKVLNKLKEQDADVKLNCRE